MSLMCCNFFPPIRFTGASSGTLPGILSAIVLAAVGAVAGYFTYQRKKLCFSNRQGNYPLIYIWFITAVHNDWHLTIPVKPFKTGNRNYRLLSAQQHFLQSCVWNRCGGGACVRVCVCCLDVGNSSSSNSGVSFVLSMVLSIAIDSLFLRHKHKTGARTPWLPLLPNQQSFHLQSTPTISHSAKQCWITVQLRVNVAPWVCA